VSQLAGQALLGTCGWSYDDWDGTFYPAGTTKKDRLRHYSEQFRTVEIDSTFYGIPTMETVQGWYERTTEGFIFSAKFPRVITHENRLMNCGEIADKFVDVMSELGEKMGPLLLQLPPSMDVRWIGALKEFLEGLPDGFTYAVEVRHRSWLVDPFAKLLKRWNVALVLPDGGPLDRFWRVTSRVVYIRWLGQWNAFDNYDRLQRDVADDLDWWTPRIEHFLDRGGIVLGYVNNNYAGHSPAVVEILNKRMGRGP
jgi:uncharacterized protein YecE (DUF72 family)